MSLSLLIASLGWGIGRSGDGKSITSDQLMFSVSAPEEYKQTKVYKSSILSIFYMTYSPTRGFSEQFLNFLPLEEIYPELVGLSREKSSAKLEELGGKKFEIPGTCLQASLFETKNLSYVVLKWSDDLGVTIMGPNDKRTQKSLNTMLATFQTPNQGCEWK